MADWRGQGSKKPNWRGDAPAPGRKASFNWKQGDAPRPGNRRRKIAASIVGLLTLAVAGIFVYIALLPTPETPPYMAMLGTDPKQYATRLDAPFDPYGWLSGKLLAEQTKQRVDDLESGFFSRKSNVPLPDGGSTTPMDIPVSTADLETWARGMASQKKVIVYVGAPVGTGDARNSGDEAVPDDEKECPFIFTKGTQRLPVVRLIRVLKKELPNVMKVIVLDSSRLPPNPVYGQIIDDFASSMKKLNTEIRDDPNLIVIVGADEHQRAWEIEEFQASLLAVAMAKVLNREEPVAGTNSVVTVKEFFDAVQKYVRDKSLDLRGQETKPFLLPLGEDGERRAEGMSLYVQPSKTAPARPLASITPEQMDDLRSLWGRHDKLNKARVWNYNPRLWRRYRELLLRYEIACRAGESDAMKSLKDELTLLTEPQFEKRNLPATLESVLNDNNLALSAALTGQFQPWRAFRASVGTFAESKSNDPAAWAIVARQFATLQKRPVEAHLPAMVYDFYLSLIRVRAGAPEPEIAKSLTEVVPVDWFTAILSRARTESAAAGLGMTNDAVYSELIWKLTQAKFLDENGGIDVERRGWEDRLFLPEAGGHGAPPGLSASLALVESFIPAQREALIARDRFFSDYPYFTAWKLSRAMTDNDLSGLEELVESWKKASASATALDRPNLELRLPEFSFADVKQSEIEAAAKDPNATLTQADWQRLQTTLAVPLLPQELRMSVLAASRNLSANLLKDSINSKRRMTASRSSIDPRRLAVCRAKLAVAMCGANLAAGLEPIVDGSTSEDKFNASLGRALVMQYRKLAENPSQTIIDADAERQSRCAIAFKDDGAWEPARVNRWLRWRDLLHDQARRTARDRWYGEGNEPYFVQVEKRYIADAEYLNDAVKANFKVYEDRNPLLTTDMLEIGRAVSSTATVYITTQGRREISFVPKVPKTFPVKGTAVWISRSNSRFERRAVWLDPVKKPDAQPVPIVIAKDTPDGAKLEAEGELFFRGYRVTDRDTLVFSKKPDREILEPLPPPDMGFSFAVRGARELDMGELVIIVDYSGSMDYKPNEDKDPDRTKGEKSKLDYALDALEVVLERLPVGTKLKVVVFSEKREDPFDYWKIGKGTYSRCVWGEGPQEGLVTWTRGNPGVLTNLMKQLRGLKPYWYTPITEAVRETLTRDFPPSASSARTLLLLTDGVYQLPKSPDDKKVNLDDEYLKARGQELKTVLRGYPNINFNVIQFALQEAERKGARKYFMQTVEPENKLEDSVIEVLSDTDSNVLNGDLVRALELGLRPRVQLAGYEGIVQPVFRRTGWPVQDRAAVDAPKQVEWKAESPMRSAAVSYTATCRPWRLPDGQTIAANRGDRLFFELAYQDKKLFLRRDLYLNDQFFPRRDNPGIIEHNDWVFMNDGFFHDRNRGTITSYAYLESMPEWMRKSPSVDIPPLLKIDRPEIHWMEVAAKTPGNGVITLKSVSLHGTPMSAWKLEAGNWPAKSHADVRIWQTNNPDLLARLRQPVSLPLEKDTTISIGGDGGSAVLRLSIESHPILKDDKQYLVLRVERDGIKPVQIRLKKLYGREFESHHYYYTAANQYTAVFGPFTNGDLQVPETGLPAGQSPLFEFELFSIGQLKSLTQPWMVSSKVDVEVVAPMKLALDLPFSEKGK